MQNDDEFIKQVKKRWEADSPGTVLTEDFIRRQLAFIRRLFEQINDERAGWKPLLDDEDILAAVSDE